MQSGGGKVGTLTRISACLARADADSLARYQRLSDDFKYDFLGESEKKELGISGTGTEGTGSEETEESEMTAIKLHRLDLSRLAKPRWLSALKVLCLTIHGITIATYVIATICFCLGVMVHTTPIKLKTGHRWLDRFAVRFNPLMSEERVFIVIVMFVGVLLTSYDIGCIWQDDLHLVTQGRFPEHMIFLFIIKMFAGFFLFSPRYLQVKWIRTGTWIFLFAVPRFAFTASMGALVRNAVRKGT